MKIKNTIVLLMLFVIVNGLVYLITDFNKEQKIKLALDDSLKTIKTHYDILLETQKITASTLYQRTIKNDMVIEILSQAKEANKEKQAQLRDKLQKLLATNYSFVKQKGVLQFHFVFPNNKVFLRMHKPSKFGDDLTDIRADFKYVNKTKKPIRVFTQGRTAHGLGILFLYLIKTTHILEQLKYPLEVIVFNGI